MGGGGLHGGVLQNPGIWRRGQKAVPCDRWQVDRPAGLQFLKSRKQNFGGGVIIRCLVHLLQVDAGGVASQGVKGGKSSSQVDADLIDAGGVELNVVLQCRWHGLLKRWVQECRSGVSERARCVERCWCKVKRCRWMSVSTPHNTLGLSWVNTEAQKEVSLPSDGGCCESIALRCGMQTGRLGSQNGCGVNVNHEVRGE